MKNKTCFKKETILKINKCRVIRSYEVKSLTNQMSKDEINKKKSIAQNNLKNKSEKKTLIIGQLKIWFDMCSVTGHNFSF